MAQKSNSDQSKTVNDAVENSPAASNRRGIILSIIGLVVGIIALGLAILPARIMGRPLPNPFASPKEEKREIAPPELEGGVTLKYKNFSVNIGGKEVEEEPKPVEPEVKITEDPLEWFTIAAMACGLIGIALSSVAQLRERHRGMSISALSCSVVAITWQYVAIGIMVGVAVVVFLILVAALAN